MPIIRFLGSLYFALFLMIVLGTLLTVSTVTESLHGTPFAQAIFYKAGWFDLFLSLLAVNIFCSAAMRFPFKRHHTGFVVTHIGILLLLAGSLLSRLGGVEGQMPLFEGERAGQILEEGHVIRAVSGGKAAAIELAPAAKGGFSVPLPIIGDKLAVHEILNGASPALAVREGPAGAMPNRAVKLRLTSAAAGFDDTFWLIERDPENPHSRFTELGPASFELENENTAPAKGGSASGGEGPELVVRQKASGREHRIALGEGAPGPSPLFDGLKITQIRYLEHARVIENKLVDSAEDVPFNPAVEIEVEDAEGRREKHTRFALFPDFDSLHGSRRTGEFGLEVELRTELPPGKTASPSFKVIAGQTGWRYRSSSSKNPEALEGALEKGRPIAAGWMDITVTAEEILEHAAVSREIKADKAGRPAALVSLASGPEEKRWLLEGGPASSFVSPAGGVEVKLERKARAVPFVLALKDFRKTDYPGTSKASSFESDVFLHDPDRGAWFERNISMNRPLDYAGFRIFQSSYFQGPSGEEGSVFTVAKNPGITLIYGGALVLLAGVLLLFYVPVFSSFSKIGAGAMALIFAALVLFGCGGKADDAAMAALGVPIQHGGRVQAFDAFSRSVMRLLSGRETLNGAPATRVLLDAMSGKSDPAELKWIEIDLPELKSRLGLDPEHRLFAYSEVSAGRGDVEALARSAQAKRDADERPSKLEQKAERLLSQMSTVESISSGRVFTIMPAVSGMPWRAPAPDEAGGQGPNFLKALSFYRSGEARNFAVMAREWTEHVHKTTQDAHRARLALEVLYLKAKPFQSAALAYLAAFILLWLARSRPALLLAGVAAAALALFFHTSGIAMRVAVLGRPPVSNMYESMIFMNWALVVLAAVMSAVFRSPAALAAGSLVSAFVMLYSNLLPIDPGMDVLVPVLRSNYWLTIHVMTVVSSYGAFGLAMGLGHRHLVLHWRGRMTADERTASAGLIDRVLQVGVILLGTGTVLGGVWANESWGRFWGWDPKETWALITLLGYLVIVHLRFLKRIGDYGLAVGAVAGFLLVLMTWYGVNFVLGRGLHSYGAGSGGMIWVLYYLAFEALFLAFALAKNVRQKTKD